MNLSIRVLEIELEGWRNFDSVGLKLPPDNNLVCLVGENGTGKSSLLELLTLVASEIGLLRGKPATIRASFDDARFVRVAFQMVSDPETFVSTLPPGVREQAEGWDGTIVLTHETHADGSNTRSLSTVSNPSVMMWPIREHLGLDTVEVPFLHLDANRSYPKIQAAEHLLGRAMRTQWDDILVRRSRASQATHDLYSDWIDYVVAQESQQATKFQQLHREAAIAGDSPPEFADPFKKYADSVLSVLPHLQFVGADPHLHSPMFSVDDHRLPFTDLSGGEREIAFLAGQIDRFQLERGLLLVDEPELHLNPDLVRTWVAFLQGRIIDGQVWIATHSLEAVEVAGPFSTHVLRVDGSHGRSITINPLAELPLIETLASSLGSPAFSLADLRFVYVEGAPGSDEAERFYQLCGERDKNRFVAGGSSAEVSRRVAETIDLSQNANEQIRCLGILDRDFKTPEEVRRLEDKDNLFVLGVHEIENLFLHPPTVQHLLDQAGGPKRVAADLIRERADELAGRWVFERARHHLGNEFGRTEVSRATSRHRTKTIANHWLELGESAEDFVDPIISPAETNEVDSRFRGLLIESWSTYESLRTTDELWQECCGKQVMHSLPKHLGLINWKELERRISQVWDDGTVDRPSELNRLHETVKNLRAISRS